MYEKKWYLRLDMQKQYDNEVIEMVRQDTYSNALIIHLIDNGVSVKLSDKVIVAIVFDKSDGTKVIGSCEIIGDGIVKYVVDYQALTALGICTITLKLIDGGVVETSTSFNINIISDPFYGTDGSVESTSEYPILTRLLGNLSGIDADIDIIKGWIENPEQFKGEQGEQGIRGEQGEQGIQGIQGVQGVQGIPGNDGIDAITVPISGHYAFNVKNDGNLYVTYLDEGNPPNFSINGDGELILTL